MVRNSALLKAFVALAAFFVAAPWAAGLSDVSEGESSSVYCVKLVGNDDGSYIELFQKSANYTPGQGEQCYEWWFTEDGSPSVYSAMQELFRANYPPYAVVLTSDLYFGGYDDSLCVSGAKAYHPFDFNSENGVILTSFGSSQYTINGVCYQGGASEASFSGNLFTTVQYVNFDNLHLESQTSAGLFSFNVGTAVVQSVRVSHSVVMAPVAGTLAGAIGSIAISGFSGNSITVNAIPKYDDGESFYVNEVNIGSLVGYCSELSVSTTRIDSVNVVYQPVSGRSYLDAALPDGKAYVGGLVGSVADIDGIEKDELVNLHQVGLENMTITDYAGGDSVSYVGGLFGRMEGSYLSVMRTYTVGDILCTSDKCVQGYGAGLIKFIQYPQVTVVANYHYSENEQERAQAFAGMVVGRYLTEYADAGVTGAPDTVITDEFNKSGYIPNYIEEYVDDERTFVKDDVSVASGNYRNAVGSISATEGFDSEAYTFDDPAEGTVPNGVLEGEYMRSAKFIEILDHIPGVLTADEVEWKFDGTQMTPYFDIATDDSGDSGEDDVEPVNVYFSFDCVRYTNCLTADERLVLLERFENNRTSPEGYVYRFRVGSDGTIENTEWLDFVYDLTLENPDREPVYWHTESSLDFSKYNVYDADVNYALEIGGSNEDDPEEIDNTEKKSYVFFGRGMNFDSTIVEIFSYDGESVEEIGDMRDMMSYSGGDQPIELQTGGVIRVVAMNPVTTDGREFKGWVLRAAIAPSTSDDVLREIAFAGVDIPVDEDGYANISEYSGQMGMRFEESILGECAVLGQNNPDIGLDSLQKLVKICAQKEDEMAKALETAVFVMALFPKGFEEENGIFDIPDYHDLQRDTVLVEAEYPMLLQSGNAIQLAVKTDEFVQEDGVPFVSVMLEGLNDESLPDTLIEFPNGGWPEVFTWEHYPLAPGSYLLTAKIYKGDDQYPEVHQWDFEVKSQIADECGKCWYMVSLSNVVLDKVNPADVNVLYWWNEQSMNGKYWQYEEITRISDVDRTRGYWYNSLEDLPLELDGNSLEDDFMVWELDSVYSGWNMVRNPFGWYIDVSELSREGYVFYRWDPEHGNYEKPRYIKPYESIWVRTSRYEIVDLPARPAFVDLVDADGNTVPYRPLQKKQVLAKASGSDDWSVQVTLSDAKGKKDSWNVLGVASDDLREVEPPEGMGDHVNLSIVEGGARLAKSVKAKNASEAYEWDMKVSASSPRMAFLDLAGLDALRAYGLRAFITIDGNTTEVTEGSKIRVDVSSTAKTVNVRIARDMKPVVAYTMQGLFARGAGDMLQVGFDVSDGLAGSRARVDVVDMKGNVVRTETFNAQAGQNTVSLAKPKTGLYVVRAVAGSQAAVQKILLR